MQKEGQIIEKLGRTAIIKLAEMPHIAALLRGKAEVKPKEK